MLITTAQLQDYLGADSDSSGIVEGCRATAIATLYMTTGRMWMDSSEALDVEIANDFIKSSAWLSFHALRGGTGDVKFIQQHITALTKQLQYGGGSDV